MDAIRTTKRVEGSWSACMVAVIIAMLAVVFLGTVYAQSIPIHVNLFAGAGAPNASGDAKIKFGQTTMDGSVEVRDLPPQPFGSGRFYGVWFVRTDTGDKAFLGALVQSQSIILSTGGAGKMEFSATHFTTGSGAGLPITLGASGTNLVTVLIENTINGLTPSPVGPVPGTGVAVDGTF